MCYDGNGEDYRGTVSRSASGFECQRWSHQVLLKMSDFPELMGGHNYCRNPGGSDSQPWCFTSNDKVLKEICGIPKCGECHFCMSSLRHRICLFVCFFRMIVDWRDVITIATAALLFIVMIACILNL